MRHYEFDLKGKGVSYSVGDCLGVFPSNSAEEVDQWLERMKWDKNEQLGIEVTDKSVLTLPSSASKGQLFTEVLDIFGKPGRRFYEFLSLASTDEAERTRLKHLLSNEGAQDLKNLVKKE